MTNVLIIDDERPTLAMFELLLQAMGYNPLAVDSGERGLEFFNQGDFPIVLTDIKMPGMDGMEVLSRIKASRPETEVIVITGHGDVDLALKALNLKATDFIDKPISQAALSAALSRAQGRMSRRKSDGPPAVLRELDGVRVLDITGSISSAMNSLEGAFSGAVTGDGLLVTISEWASINGAGIESLGAIIKLHFDAGKPVAIACRPENFRRVFEAAGLTSMASLHENETDALAALRQNKT